MDARLLPWKRKEFDGWLIVGMNHYRIEGERRLFVAMAKHGRCIKSEGADNALIWEELARQACDAQQ